MTVACDLRMTASRAISLRSSIGYKMAGGSVSDEWMYNEVLDDDFPLVRRFEIVTNKS